MELPENLWGKKKFSLIDRCPENTKQFLAPVSHVSPGPLSLSQCGNKDARLRLWNCFFQWKFMPRLEISEWYNICHYIQIILFVWGHITTTSTSLRALKCRNVILTSVLYETRWDTLAFCSTFLAKRQTKSQMYFL